MKLDLDSTLIETYGLRPATERQVAALRRRGIDVGPKLTAGTASALLDVALAGAALAPATARQVWRLRRMGLPIPAGLTKREASALIDEAMRRRRR